MPGADVPRHYHREGYANIVLEGSFTEAAFVGQSRPEAGDVLLHAAFDAHANTSVSNGGVTVLRLPWDRDSREGCFRLIDPDRIARLAETDVRAAQEETRQQLGAVPDSVPAWPERLAADLRRRSQFRLQDWADANGLAPETISRNFKRCYGISPQRYRLESKTRQAWRRVLRESISLTDLAHDSGFADLAHMTRNITLLTGYPPSHWRHWQAVDQTRSSQS